MGYPEYAGTAERCFPGTTDSVPQARSWLGAWLDSLGVTNGLATDAALVLSELATNAATHTRSAGPHGHYTVRVVLDLDTLQVEVADAGSPNEPRTPTPESLLDPLAEHGRGLALIDLYAARWWTEGDTTGRTVTAELDRGA